MTPREVDLVQTSFRSVLLISDSTAQLFYARLFALHPQLKPLFKSDPREQGKKFMYTLGAAVAYAWQMQSVVPALEALAQRHVGYGVQPSHYQAVGEALMWSLSQGLGDAFTDEVRAAWSTLYREITQVMQKAAYGRASECTT
jgi:nitric oxide dioxygenase